MSWSNAFVKELLFTVTDKDPYENISSNVFYSNYKDYYYLPEEDQAIHKSVAEFVDRAYRMQASASNCYTRKPGQFLREWDLVFTPFFKKEYKSSDMVELKFSIFDYK